MEKEWYSLSEEEVAKELGTDALKGLSEEQVEEIRKNSGFNEITTKGKKSIAQMLFEQFKDFMIIILLHFMGVKVYNICYKDGRVRRTIENRQGKDSNFCWFTAANRDDLIYVTKEYGSVYP